MGRWLSVGFLGRTDPHPPLRPEPTLTHRPLAGHSAAGADAALAGCGGGDDYFGAVEEHQAGLTDVTASGSPAALLTALPIFRALAVQAPDDIRDDWEAFLDPPEELDDTFRAVNVDPAAYDPEELPVELSEEERSRIEAAGAALAGPAVAQAFDSVQQHAKDVCHTPLSL